MDIEVIEERDRDMTSSCCCRSTESTARTHVHSNRSSWIVSTMTSCRLIIDFSHLNFISSSGLRVLLIAVKKLNANQGKLVLCDMQEHIHEVFQISGFDQLIPIRDSRQSAMDVF